MSRIMEDVSKWPVEKRREVLEKAYFERMGMTLDLDNPKRLSEKIQWRKLYEKDSRRTMCVDKRTFKKYVRDKIGEGHSAPLIDVWHSSADVDLTTVPDKCVIKSNCASEGRYCYVINGKDKLDIYEAERNIRGSWFDRRYLNTNSMNNAYYDVVPCVIIEEYLADPQDIDEFKIYCFDGEPRYLYRYSGHFEDGKNMYTKYPIRFYTSDWKALDVRLGNFGLEEKKEAPYCFDEMKEIARKLSKDFSFVRVDFFVTSSNFYVAEMCFNPLTGLEPYYPDEFDIELGSLWNYPPVNENA